MRRSSRRGRRTTRPQRDVERGERLYADKVISLEQLQDLRTQAPSLKQGSIPRSSTGTTLRSSRRATATVLRRLAEERELVSAGNPVLVSARRISGFVVRTGLADREIVQVKLGDEAEIKLDALPDASLRGKVTEVASAADPASGMFGIEVSLAPVDLPLKSGLVAKLTIVTCVRHVRRARLCTDRRDRRRRRRYRASLRSRSSTRRAAATSRSRSSDGERVALASGVEAGEQVITDGAQYLEDGEASRSPSRRGATTHRVRERLAATN